VIVDFLAIIEIVIGRVIDISGWCF